MLRQEGKKNNESTFYNPSFHITGGAIFPIHRHTERDRLRLGTGKVWEKTTGADQLLKKYGKRLVDKLCLY